VENQPNQERINQFKIDVRVFSTTQPKISHTKIAEAMGVKKTNFSSYLNGKLPITENFLARFYEIWGHELEKRKTDYHISLGSVYGARDPAVITYGKKSYKDQYLATLKKNNDALLTHLDKMADHMTKLVDNNEKLVENHQTLMAAHLTILGKQGGQTEGPGQ
jgi:hypothetical protein